MKLMTCTSVVSGISNTLCITHNWQQVFILVFNISVSEKKTGFHHRGRDFTAAVMTLWRETAANSRCCKEKHWRYAAPTRTPGVDPPLTPDSWNMSQNGTDLICFQVTDSSKRWWKCRNDYDQIGFVPSNILEPLSALSNVQGDGRVVRRESKVKTRTHTYFFMAHNVPHCEFRPSTLFICAFPQQRTPIRTPSSRYSYTPTSPDGTSPTLPSPIMRPQSMILPSTGKQEDSDRGETPETWCTCHMK